MGVQTFTTPSGDRMVVVPEADYEALIGARDDRADASAVDAFRRDLAEGTEELVPAELVDRLMNGDNKIKAWREYRGLTIKVLAERAGITQPFLSQIESGAREGKIDTLQNIAAVLGVSLIDLIDKPINVRVGEILAEGESLTIAEIAARVAGSESHVRGICDWLVDKGEAVRLGAARPYRYAAKS